jgi:hypothetical protein
MAHPDDPGPWRERFVDALRLIGSAAARLPYGVPEPVLGGHAAIELYSGGHQLARDFELLTAEPRRLQAELMGTGFRRDERCSCDAWTLRHPALEFGLNIAMRPPVNANVVFVEVGAEDAHNAATIRVIGIENLIADQIASRLDHGGRPRAITTLVQVLVELGRAGVGGPFRPAYLQRRLARETEGEADLEPSPAADSLDDLAPRMTSLTAIAGVVRSWRTKRGLSGDATSLFGSRSRARAGTGDTRRGNAIEGPGGLTIMTAQIIPFRPLGQ